MKKWDGNNYDAGNNAKIGMFLFEALNQLLDNGKWTKIDNPIVDSKPLPVRKIK